MTWKYFESQLSETQRDDGRKLRPIFNKFLRVVKDILNDDEVPTEELHSAARLIYNICNDVEGSEDVKKAVDEEDEEAVAKSVRAKKAALKASFPTFQDKQWDEASNLAQHLYAWRTERARIKAERDKKRESAAPSTSSGVAVAALTEKDVMGNKVYSLVDFLTNVPEIYSKSDLPLPNYEEMAPLWQPIGDFSLPGDDGSFEDPGTSLSKTSFPLARF